MNILVYNIAAEYAGALTILKTFYQDVLNWEDKSHNWYFVVSNGELDERENVKVVCVPWIKKSWAHRWYYDKFCARKLVKEYDIDFVFSMQNMPIEGVRCKQIVYLHQSLQFSPVRYSLLKKEERGYWIRQNIISKIMKKSLKNAHSIIVQTQWMKEATKNWLKTDGENIQVVPPSVKLNGIGEKQVERACGLFIYPAGDGIHKNHKLILNACELLKEQGVAYRVIFTLDKDESCYAQRLYLETKKKELNIEFVGLLASEEIMCLYKKATLLFPSYIETFGLPLLEAKLSGGLILCSNLPFSHEILDNYNNAYYFEVEDAVQLAKYMKDCCENVIVLKENLNIKEDFGEKEDTLVKRLVTMR